MSRRIAGTDNMLPNLLCLHLCPASVMAQIAWNRVLTDSGDQVGPVSSPWKQILALGVMTSFVDRSVSIYDDSNTHLARDDTCSSYRPSAHGHVRRWTNARHTVYRCLRYVAIYPLGDVCVKRRTRLRKKKMLAIE